jgi:phospholipid/cholesterol/gamma-HCH transport system substrate-binding protein
MQTATQTLHKAGSTLEQSSAAIANMNSLITDPKLQADLRATVAALPVMIEETRQTITAARGAVANINSNLENLSKATQPIAEHSDVVVRRLSGSLIQMEALLTELNQFAQMINRNEGTLQKFTSDPKLYENLNTSAASLAVLLKNLEPMLADLRVFSDRIARHPEILGVSGAMQPSSGLKNASEVDRASYQTQGDR